MTTGSKVVECDFEWFDRYFVAISELLMASAMDIAVEADASEKVSS